MRIAFVGVKRKLQELPPGYIYNFVRYHLELPFYYARADNDVTVTAVDTELGPDYFRRIGDGLRHPQNLRIQSEGGFGCLRDDFDVVIHWRKWFPELYCPEAINVINCQDHSFGQEWQDSARKAFEEGKLYGVLCFPTWHRRNLLRECPWLPEDRAISGLTLGVDTDVYRPADDKDPYQLLWASDPGRGLWDCLEFFQKLRRIDQRFVLNVCWPDYCQTKIEEMPTFMPGVRWWKNISNGPELWKLFNTCGILPYTSTFAEPSSRAHRQMQASGGVVVYPPGMGSPSDLIRGDRDGVVAPTGEWPRIVQELVWHGRWKEIGAEARRMAVSENWDVQAQRFKEHFERVIGERR